MTRWTIAVVSPGVSGAAATKAMAAVVASPPAASLPGASPAPDSGLIEIDVAIDPVGDLDPRRSWPSPPPAGAVIQCPDDRRPALAVTLADAGIAVLGLVLVRRSGFGHRSGPGGLRQISFVTPLDGVCTEEFAQRYRAHQELVRIHHPGVAEYRQDVVLESETADDHTADDHTADDHTTALAHVAAVSQLWFRPDAAFGHDYYASDESRDVIAADVAAFIDRRRTWSVLTRRA